MIHDKLCYGVPESVDNRYLYIRKIVISNYHNPENVEYVMECLSTMYKFYQYNSNDKKESDYFFWQYVDSGTNIKNFQSVEISVYNADLDYIYKMRKLVEFFKDNNNFDVNVDVYYDNIYNLLDKIDSDIKFENSLKKESE